MAKQKPGVYDRVLECAKEEFLRGFWTHPCGPLPRRRAPAPGPSTPALGIKRAVPPCRAGGGRVPGHVPEIQESFHQLDDETQQAEMGRYTARHQMDLLDYIYDHFDVFRLLLDGAHGTRFACFLDELVDIEVEYTYRYMEVIGCESVKSGQVTEEFIHIIVTAYFNGMFEVVRHNMDRAAAHRYVKMLNDYHMAGFGTVFDPQP